MVRNFLVAARRLRLLGVLPRVRGVGTPESVQDLRLHGDDCSGMLTHLKYKVGLVV